MNTTKPDPKSNLGRLAALGLVLGAASCTSLPEPKMERFSFPQERAFVGNVSRPYEKLGLVRTKVDYLSLDPQHDEDTLCRNYYNKAVQDLVRLARKQGGDAVIDVKSVVFFEDGSSELHSTPECSDEGQAGQVLTQGIAIKWKPEPKPSVTPTAGPVSRE